MIVIHIIVGFYIWVAIQEEKEPAPIKKRLEKDENDVFATQQYCTQNVYLIRQIGRYLKSKANQEKESRFKSEHTYYVCYDSIIFFLRCKNFQFGYFLLLQSKIEETK